MCVCVCVCVRVHAHCCGHMLAFCEFLLLGTCKCHMHFMCACAWEPMGTGVSENRASEARETKRKCPLDCQGFLEAWDVAKS